MKDRKRYCKNPKCNEHLLKYSPLNMMLTGYEKEYICTKCNTLYREDKRKPKKLKVKERILEQSL